MSTSIADERRLLAAEEYEPVARSHYPALAGLGRDEVLDAIGERHDADVVVVLCGGVRQLERQIGAVARKVARRIAAASSGSSAT